MQTQGESIAGIITRFMAIKNCKELLRSKKVADLLGFDFIFKLLSFQEEPPLPNGKTSLGQHHWHLLMNVFPSQQMYLPGTYTTKQDFYRNTLKYLPLFHKYFY